MINKQASYSLFFNEFMNYANENYPGLLKQGGIARRVGLPLALIATCIAGKCALKSATKGGGVPAKYEKEYQSTMPLEDQSERRKALEERLKPKTYKGEEINIDDKDKKKMSELLKGFVGKKSKQEKEEGE